MIILWFQIFTSSGCSPEIFTRFFYPSSLDAGQTIRGWLIEVTFFPATVIRTKTGVWTSLRVAAISSLRTSVRWTGYPSLYICIQFVEKLSNWKRVRKCKNLRRFCVISLYPTTIYVDYGVVLPCLSQVVIHPPIARRTLFWTSCIAFLSR